jgi:hypothetical protein
MILVTRSNSNIKKRFRKKRYINSRIKFYQVKNDQFKFTFVFCCSIRDPNKYEHFESAKYEALVGQERNAFEGAKRELDQCKTKIEGLSHDVIDFFSSFS